jgi:hypothetical protein
MSAASPARRLLLLISVYLAASKPVVVAGFPGAPVSGAEVFVNGSGEASLTRRAGFNLSSQEVTNRKAV